MRIKGISWIEQHFEKLVAGLFGLALMGVLAWQFGGPKETVKVGNEQVPLDQTIDKLGEVARGAKGRLSQSEPPSMEGADKIRAEIAAAEKALAGHIAPTPTLPAPLDEAVAIRATCHAVSAVGPAATFWRSAAWRISEKASRRSLHGAPSAPSVTRIPRAR